MIIKVKQHYCSSSHVLAQQQDLFSALVNLYPKSYDFAILGALIDVGIKNQIKND